MGSWSPARPGMGIRNPTNAAAEITGENRFMNTRLVRIGFLIVFALGFASVAAAQVEPRIARDREFTEGASLDPNLERGADLYQTCAACHGPDGRGTEEIRPARSTGELAVATMACPDCDAPVMPAGTVCPADLAICPFCGTSGAVRDFLTLEDPARPARVVVRVVLR